MSKINASRNTVTKSQLCGMYLHLMYRRLHRNVMVRWLASLRSSLFWDVTHP